MKKIIIPAVAIVALAAAGGGWYAFARHGDPLENARRLTASGDLRGAQIELRNAVRINPGSAEAHIRLAQSQLESGDAVAAEKEIKAGRELGYDIVQASLLLGQSYVAQARWHDLLAEVPSTAPMAEQTAMLLVIRGMAQLGLDDVEAAKAAFAKAEGLAPKNTDARLALGRIAATQQKFELADQKADETLAIDPKRADALMLKAQVKLARGDRTAALALYDQAVDTAPQLVRNRLERANLLLAVGQDAKARADVDFILARQPGNAAALFTSMVLLIRAGKFAEAETVSQKLEPVAQQFPRAPYFDAMIKANIGQIEQAVAQATRYVARTPNDPDGIRLLARTQVAARRPGDAVATLTKAIAGGMQDAETLDLLGRAYALDGKQPLAAQSFQKAATLAPRDPGILTRLASTEMQMGNVPAATSALERSLEISPAQPNAGEALVAAALTTGDLDRAQAALDRLREATGDTEAVGILDAQIKLSRLDLEGARAQFAATLAKFPQSATAKLNLAKTLVLQGKHPDGIVLLKEMNAKDRANNQVIGALVPILVQDNRTPEAISVLEAARAAVPNSLGYTVLLAELLTRSGESQKAITMLDGLRVDGTLPPELSLALARAQVAAGKVADARSTYDRLLAAAPGNLNLRQAQVDFLLRSGDVPGAKDSMRDALKLTPGNVSIMQAMVGLEAQSNGLDAGLALADQLRNAPANLPGAAVLKGDAYMSARRFTDAQTAFSAEFKAAPSTMLLLRSVGAATAAGATDQALQLLRTWLAQHPDDPDAAQSLASMDINAKRYPEAEKNLLLVLDKRPNDPIALNNLAWVYQIRGDARAHATAQRAFLQLQSPETSDTLGWILVSEGQSARALLLLQQASAQRPQDKSVKFHLATALKDVGQTEEATKLLQALVDDPAEFDDKAAAREALGKLGVPRP